MQARTVYRREERKLDCNCPACLRYRRRTAYCWIVSAGLVAAILAIYLFL